MEFTNLPELEAALDEECRDNNMFASDEDDVNDYESVCLRIPDQDAYSSDEESIYDEGKLISL